MMRHITMLGLAASVLVAGLAAQTAQTPAQPPAPAPAQAPTREAKLKVGDKAPEFALQGSDGKVHKLSDYKGKTVVVAWFPKAFTGG